MEKTNEPELYIVVKAMASEIHEGKSRIAELEKDNTALRQRIEKMNDYLRNNGMEPF